MAQLLPQQPLYPNELNIPEFEQPRQINVPHFRDDAVYKYIYEGQVLTGMPQTAAQFSGMKMRALVRLVLRTGAPDQLLVEKFWLGQMHEEFVVRPSEQQPIGGFTQLPPNELRELTHFMSIPVEFEYRNGIVSIDRIL